MIVIYGIVSTVVLYALYRMVEPRLGAWLSRAERSRADTPRPFGPRLPWIAVKTANTRGVLEALGLEEAETINWKYGLSTVAADTGAADKVFVTPPVLGWTLVLGAQLPGPVSPRFVDKCTPLLSRLSRTFGEAHFFQGDEKVDLYAWARVVDGDVKRAFAIGDEGLIWIKGQTTREERGLGLKLFEIRSIDGGAAAPAIADLFAYPTAEDVLQMAAEWSIDPSRIAPVDALPAAGYIGRAPMAWRAQRQRR